MRHHKDLASRRQRREALLSSITPEEQARLDELSRARSAPERVEQVFTMTVDDAVKECQVSIEEACAENPDVNPDDVAHDVIISYQMWLVPGDRKEFRERCGLYI